MPEQEPLTITPLALVALEQALGDQPSPTYRKLEAINTLYTFVEEYGEARVITWVQALAEIQKRGRSVAAMQSGTGL